MLDRGSHSTFRRDAAEALAVTAGYAETIERVAALAVPRLAALCLIDIDEAGALTRRAAVTDPELALAPIRLEAPHPDVGEGAPAVLRAGKPLFYGRGWFEALGRVDPALGELPGDAIRTVMVLPLTFDRKAIGVLTLGMPHAIDEDALALAEEFTRLAAVAISNARLLEDARRARDNAEAARSRLSFVARAGAVLSRSFDRDTTLQRLLGTTVIDFAESAFGMIVDSEGAIERLYAGTRDGGELETLALEAMRDARTRLDATTQTLAVPLLTLGRVGGALAFRRSAARPPIAIDDLTMIEEIAARVAMFVEMARSFAHQRNVAETLQRAFRPHNLPAIDGLVISAAYQPGTADVDVGGDWYDVIVLDETRIAFAIGDVMGHGVESAAAMAELRSGLRAHLYAAVPPGRCLGFVDTLLTYSGGAHDMFATGCTAIYDRTTCEMTIANAGHPPPFLRRMNGDLIPLAGPSPLLGLDAGERIESRHQLGPGDVVLFYTDGVIEDRARTYEEGLADLESALHAAPEPRVMIERILSTTLASSDDRTLLAFRVDPQLR